MVNHNPEIRSSWTVRCCLVYPGTKPDLRITIRHCFVVINCLLSLWWNPFYSQQFVYHIFLRDLHCRFLPLFPGCYSVLQDFAVSSLYLYSNSEFFWRPLKYSKCIRKGGSGIEFDCFSVTSSVGKLLLHIKFMHSLFLSLFDVWYFVQCQGICRSHVLASAPLRTPRKKGILQLHEFSFVSCRSSQISNQKFVLIVDYTLLIPVAARSKAWVCCRSPAGIAGSNPSGFMDVCRKCCVVR